MCGGEAALGLVGVHLSERGPSENLVPRRARIEMVAFEWHLEEWFLWLVSELFALRAEPPCLLQPPTWGRGPHFDYCPVTSSFTPVLRKLIPQLWGWMSEKDTFW